MTTKKKKPTTTSTERMRAARDRLRANGGKEVLITLDKEGVRGLERLMKETGETASAIVLQSIKAKMAPKK